MNLPENNSVPRKVVILLSDKRSGSTIIQDELIKHPDIQHVTYSPHTYSETMHWLKGARVLNMPKQTFYGHQYYATFNSAHVARAYLVDCLAGNDVKTDSFKDDRELVFGGWEALCSRFAQPVFFEKSPQYLSQWCCLSLLIEWIASTQFDVKVIGLVRNPLSVLYSSEELFHTDSQVRQFNWSEKYRNLIAFSQMIDPEQFLLVRYEDLITEPLRQFAGLQEFIGIESREEIGSQVHSSSKEKWRNDENYGLQLHESVKQVARFFGYSEDELANEGKSARRPPLSARVKNYLNRTKESLLNRTYRVWKLRKK